MRAPDELYSEEECRVTARDVELLQALADGKTYKEIAAEMSNRLQVVKNRASQVRLKLDARTTMNAVATAIRRGLID